MTLTNYLSNILTTVLLSLPTELKDLMLFNAISHTASQILAQPLSPDVTKITSLAVKQLSMDVQHFADYVRTLPNNLILLESLDELTQTIALMATDQPEEFYDISLRNKKYGAVDPLKGPQLLEKVVPATEISPTGRESSGTAGGRMAAFQQRFMQGGR